MLRQMAVDCSFDESTHPVGRNSIKLASEIVRPLLVGSRLALGFACGEVPVADLPPGHRESFKVDLDTDLIREAFKLLLQRPRTIVTSAVKVAEVIDVVGSVVT